REAIMKIATTFLILILTFSMFSIAIPIASNPTTDLAIHDTTSTLAATPGYEATVIRVTDDAPVTESSPDTNYELSNLLDCSNASGYLSRSCSYLKMTLGQRKPSPGMINLSTTQSLQM
ncbi:MAG: hypothetical protein ACXAAN_16765, partial [Candidatus Thorarchaeota archaeon]